MSAEVAQVKEKLRTLASHAVVRGRISRLGRLVGDREGAFILYGHRVADDDEGYMQGLPPRWLDEQLAYLTRHYEVISLARLVACLERGERVPSRSVVLTFDDGFRDNYENALPLLQKHGVPATIFLVTGALSHGDLPWSQRLGYLFQNTDAPELPADLAEGGPLSLITAGERKAAYRAIKPGVARLGRERRDERISALSRALRVEPPRDRMMTWHQAREMQAYGVELGAHTYSHPLLAAMEPEEARWEMERSRDDLARELGVERPTFCFPAGSMSPSLLSSVPKLGFRSCFLPGQGIRINALGRVDPFSLARVGMPNAPAVYLEAELDGPFHALRTLAGRR